ncbi:MAG: NAD(P)H-dependent oxidoreductase [Tabrizicola sp.]|jgi:putative NADPH-quinone reductase|nr:NAD(P)H-dependent oxidoreductase [Tabrizicola sp.]
MTTRALVLYAHPCGESFAATLRDTVTGTLAARGWDVDLCDLYAEGFDPVLGADERRGYHDTATNTLPVQSHVDRLRAAQALIFVHPVWNFGMPAILKGYTDRVFLPGITFSLQDGKVRPAMTHIRKLASVTTYGASRVRAFLAGDPPRRVVSRAFRHACQPDRFLYMALYDMNRADAGQRADYLARVQRKMEHF